MHRVPKAIFDKKVTRGGRVKYRVEFEGLGVAHAEWWDRADVSEALIEDFERRARGRRVGQSLSALTTELEHKFRTSSTATDSIVSIDSDFSSRTKPRAGRTVERPVVYISRTTKPYERNYESTERELACVVWCFKRCRHMLEGSKVVIISDHLSIKEVLNSSANTVYSVRIDKARMDMAPYLEDVEIRYRPGRNHVNVDPLSRAV